MKFGCLQFILALPFSARQRRLASIRSPMDGEAFVRVIAAGGGDAEAAAATWQWLKEWGYAPKFTPHPDDELQSVFGIAEEERDEDLILAVLAEVGIPVPEQGLVAQFGKVDTLRQVAEFAAFCRRAASA